MEMTIYRQFSSDDEKPWELKRRSAISTWFGNYKWPIMFTAGMVALVYRALF